MAANERRKHEEQERQRYNDLKTCTPEETAGHWMCCRGECRQEENPEDEVQVSLRYRGAMGQRWICQVDRCVWMKVFFPVSSLEINPLTMFPAPFQLPIP